PVRAADRLCPGEDRAVRGRREMARGTRHTRTVEDLTVSASRSEAIGLRGRSALVTGGYGLLGSWLVKALLDQGARIVVLRRDEPVTSGLEAMGLHERIDVVHGDVSTDGLVARALNEYEVDSVFHLAAQTVVGNASRSPLPTF